jgi:signal transduction histidine kinase
MNDSDKLKQGVWPIYAGIGAVVVVISLLHYFTNLQWHILHTIFQRLYYIPIVFAAVVFGFRGGLITALVSVIVYVPHVYFQWGMGQHFGDQISDMGMFLVVGAATGALSDREKLMKSMYREAYEKLQASFEKSQHAARLAALGQMAAAVAHEIRNPLNGIRGAQDIILEKIGPDDPERKFADIVRRETRRIEDIVNEFLDFARPREPNRMNVNIGNVAASVMELCGSQAAGRGVSLNGDIPEGGIFATADADQLRQVLLNLTLNGIDACEPGGEVRIAVKQQHENVLISVIDTGSGMSGEDRARLFEPFFTTKPSGTGLGLAVSLRIVENHGGRIDVKTSPGTGSEFTVILPV